MMVGGDEGLREGWMIELLMLLAVIARVTEGFSQGVRDGVDESSSLSIAVG